MKGAEAVKTEFHRSPGDRTARWLLRAIEWARREPLFHALRELERNQYLDPDEIAEIQATKLHRLLSVAGQHPFYRDRLSSRFDETPLLLKEELRSNFDRIVTPGSEGTVDLCKTSGSTGRPLRFYRDKLVFGYTLASVYRAHRWHGLDIGAREAMLWGIPSDATARLSMHVRDIVLNRFRESEYDLSTEVLNDFYRKCQRRRPAYLFGYSSMVYEFALFVRTAGLEGRCLGLKAAICTAESIPVSYRQEIQETLGCRVVSEYGAAESGIISYECPLGSHHISEDTVLLELLGADNRPVPDGEVGRVVVTVLHSTSAPIIRYALGDFAIRSSLKCDCGVNLGALDRIIGRTSGVIVTPSGKCFHSIALYYVMKDYAARFGAVRQFRAVQTALNQMDVYLVQDTGATTVADEFLAHLVQKKFGGELNVTFIKCEQLPRSASGKLSDFESRLDSNALMLKSFGSLGEA